MPNPSQLQRLIDVMRALRHAQTGCPWNREQTHVSLRRHLLEETYETLDAIDSGHPKLLREELGDLLLQIVFHSQIAEEAGQFSLEDVAHDEAEKMIRRHPHVFDETCRLSARESLSRWDEIKKQEKLAKGEVKPASVLDGISKSFPALYETEKIARQAARLGFDWENPADVFAKVDEEIAEVKAALAENSPAKIEEEFGDLLFTLANLCRVYKVNPEVALHAANQKFRARFAKMEKAIDSAGLSFDNLDSKKWNRLWEDAKKVL